ncbi:hypothetical protein MRX96_026899 [Rhipicephalus microplus]
MRQEAPRDRRRPRVHFLADPPSPEQRLLSATEWSTRAAARSFACQAAVSRHAIIITGRRGGTATCRHGVTSFLRAGANAAARAPRRMTEAATQRRRASCRCGKTAKQGRFGAWQSGGSADGCVALP